MVTIENSQVYTWLFFCVALLDRIYLLLYNDSMATLFSISHAAPNDVPEILLVRKVTWLATYPNPEFGINYTDIEEHLDKRNIGALEKWQKRIQEDQLSHTWVAKSHGKVIGYIWSGKGENKNTIESLYVLPDYHHNGIGEKLMNATLEWLGNNRKISLDVVTYNTKAINFYKKFGFIEHGPTTNEAGNLPSGKQLPEIEMIKSFS